MVFVTVWRRCPGKVGAKRQNEAGAYRREGVRDMTSAGYESLGKSGRMAKLLAGALLVTLALAFVVGPAGAATCSDCGGGGGDGGDTIAPTVTSVSPASGASDVLPAANVTVTFSEEMDLPSITSSTFTLVRQGQTTPVAATVSYDPATKTATLNPDADLAQKASYTATVKGGSGGVTDLAGNPLAADHAWSFTVPDTTKPIVRLTSPVSGTYVRGTVQIGAEASDNVGMSHVALRVQGGAWSEYDYSAPYGMSWDSTQSRDGSVSLQAIAYDTSLNSADHSYNFIVDNTAPVADVSGPDGQTFSPGSTQTWTFSASDATSGLASVQCSVVTSGSPESFGPCSGTNASHSVSNLPVGSYTMSVRVTDRVGNVVITPERSFSIVPLLRLNDVRVKEKTTYARFTVRLSAASQQTVTVNYTTANGTAKAPADYATRRGTLTFLPGQTARAIAVPIRSDRRNERNEVFFVNLSRQTNATIADRSGRGTIIDND
jgi:hypothetical protein